MNQKLYLSLIFLFRMAILEQRLVKVIITVDIWKGFICGVPMLNMKLPSSSLNIFYFIIRNGMKSQGNIFARVLIPNGLKWI